MQSHKKKLKPQREKHRRRLAIARYGFFASLLALIALQAIYGIERGDFGGKNYYNQPINPFIQLAVVGATVIVGIVKGIQVWKRRGAKQHTNRNESHDLADRPPRRWPWN